MLKEGLKNIFGVVIGTILWALILGIVIGGLLIWLLAYFSPCILDSILPNIACACP